MKVHRYEDLVVWQKAMDLVYEIYTLTNGFPKEEMYGLVSQMRRCAVSIPSNIAEGSRRGTAKDFGQFLNIAFGSGAELETQIKICKRIGFLKDVVYNKSESLLDETMRLLNKFIEKIKQ